MPTIKATKDAAKQRDDSDAGQAKRNSRGVVASRAEPSTRGAKRHAGGRRVKKA